MTKPALPDAGSQEYLWWSQGAGDEARFRDQGLSPSVLELRAFLERYSRMHPGKSQKDLITTMMRVYCPERLRRGHRGGF